MYVNTTGTYNLSSSTDLLLNLQYLKSHTWGTMRSTPRSNDAYFFFHNLVTLILWSFAHMLSFEYKYIWRDRNTSFRRCVEGMIKRAVRMISIIKKQLYRILVRVFPSNQLTCIRLSPLVITNLIEFKQML